MTGNVLDAFHQLDQLLPVLRLAGGEADAAIAHDGGRHAMPGRRCRVLVPHRLAVIVRVDVDKTGRHDPALGGDLLAPFRQPLADGADPALVDSHISFSRRATRAVDHRAAANDEIMRVGHAANPPARCLL